MVVNMASVIRHEIILLKIFSFIGKYRVEGTIHRLSISKMQYHIFIATYLENVKTFQNFQKVFNPLFFSLIT